ncbi:MAG: adenylate/guanylate cyclase [Candidatus Solibacter sp.]|nr:adenylate/guanylate cyclase [Candidatus Solibacter sp.]
MASSDLLPREDLVALLETAGQLATEADQARLADAILTRACQMTNSPDGSVLLFDPDRGGLFFAAAKGEKGPSLLENWGEYSSQRVPVAGSKAGLVYTTGVTILEQRLDDDTDHFKGVDEQTSRTSQSMICAALEVGGTRIGAIQILNKPGPYTDRDLALLEQFAVQAAAAIKNSRRLRELAAHMGLYARDLGGDLLGLLTEPARREDISVMFADMRGFTQLCQSQEDPAHTQAIVNDLLTMLAEQVLTHGGVVNKFLGDAVLAFFRTVNGPKQAVRCAFGMLERFESLRQRWGKSSNQDLDYLDLGIGIATDRVALGAFGSASVRDFTAIGTAVNRASAFEHAARNGHRVLVDRRTWDGARELIADHDEPERFELRKPDQGVGIVYWKYHLKRLKPDLVVRVFISHSHLDRVYVEREVTHNLKQYGIETWYSNTDLIPGENYIETIQAGLLRSDWFVVIVSARSVASDWVRAEVRTAFSDARLKDRIIPIVIDDTSPALLHNELATVHPVFADKGDGAGKAIYEALRARTAQLRS